MGTTSKWIAGLLIGLFVGAVAGILLAPSSGEETREELLGKIDLLKEKINELVEKGGEFTNEKIELLKQKISQLEKEIETKETA
ncbi:YtxH domain-containing protein [Flavicella marina]|uniref:YtxH domain-containing protein n=1 Tax=Flavicella marina TaxID=1475951 RepID=UPI00126568D4|nr:YtxH domain-containing protein [Flavicella marina]